MSRRDDGERGREADPRLAKIAEDTALRLPVASSAVTV